MTSSPARWSALTRSRNSSTAACAPGPAAVRGVRREERHRLVAPVVRPPVGRVERVELVDGQQLDGRDPEVDEVRDLLDEPGVRAAPRRVDARVRVRGEPPHVGLVDDRVGERPAQRPVALPVVAATVDHDALHRAQVGDSGPCSPTRPASAGSRRARPRHARTGPAASGRRRTAGPVRVPRARAPGSAYSCPPPTPGTKACQYGPVRSASRSSATTRAGTSSSARSNSTSSTAVARFA